MQQDRTAEGGNIVLYHERNMWPKPTEARAGVSFVGTDHWRTEWS